MMSPPERLRQDAQARERGSGVKRADMIGKCGVGASEQPPIALSGCLLTGVPYGRGHPWLYGRRRQRSSHHLGSISPAYDVIPFS